jgi:hypothetical protein
MSLAPSLTQASPVRSGRAGLIALWIAQIALAGMFLLAGGSKLLGAPAMVGLFDAIGIGQWFRYLTGLIEVGSACAARALVRGVRGLGTRGDDGRCDRDPPLHSRRLARDAGDSPGRLGSSRVDSKASDPRRPADGALTI